MSQRRSMATDNNQRSTPTTTDRLLTVDDVADYLGVPRATLYAWRYQNAGPPALRVGRHLRYRRADLDAWVQTQLSDARR